MEIEKRQATLNGSSVVILWGSWYARLASIVPEESSRKGAYIYEQKDNAAFPFTDLSFGYTVRGRYYAGSRE